MPDSETPPTSPLEPEAAVPEPIEAAEVAPEPVEDIEQVPEPVEAAVPEPVEAAVAEPIEAAEAAPEPVEDIEQVPVGAAEAPEPPVEAVESEAPTPAESEVPTPADLAAPPRPAGVPAPSPAIFAKRHGPPDRSAFGRVDDDGQVYVKTADGERAVGSYPGATPGEALAYFARKYDELVASADLLRQRVDHTDVSTKDAADSLDKLREQTHEPNVVGDLSALDAKVADIAAALEVRRTQENEHRKAAREEGRIRRERLVAEAERIASQPEQSIQWKSSGARMRELLDEWKQQQRSGPRLERSVETALWQRFSAARNSFDRLRRVHFAQLDTQQGAAKTAKEKLVVEAERLATSKDWAATAGAFKGLMDDWRKAGRAGRADDDALWERFKAAQDSFFAAKDAVVAKEEEGFRANLEVKQRLLHEAEAILPVTDLEKAKTSLRSIQERWDKAGKVPRADVERTEKSLRRVEQAVRDAEDKRWASSNPEAAARARSLVDQLEAAVTGLRSDLEKAQSSGNQRTIDDARAALEAREQWLAQARAGLEEFGS